MPRQFSDKLCSPLMIGITLAPMSVHAKASSCFILVKERNEKLCLPSSTTAWALALLLEAFDLDSKGQLLPATLL